MTSHDDPPTVVESTQRGVMPMYSATSTGAIVPSPVDANPSIWSGRNPASERARREACAISAYGVMSSTLPTSDNATPAMATRRPMRRS